MKKILWISIALALTGCGKQAQTETTVTPTTTVIEQTSVSKELAEQASKEIEELSRLEEEGKVVYDEESGDITAVIGNEEETHNQVMEVLREEVRTGKLVDAEIDETVRVVCDFLEESKQNEFISELHSLIPTTPTQQTEVSETKSQETKSAETKSHNESKPAPTQPAPTQPAPQQTQAPAVTPQPQQTEPVYQETAPQPQPAPQPENNNTSGEIDTSGWSLGGGSVEVVPGGSPQNLTDEQIDKINNSTWN